jgi:hypothetical protein
MATIARDLAYWQVVADCLTRFLPEAPMTANEQVAREIEAARRRKRPKRDLRFHTDAIYTAVELAYPELDVPDCNRLGNALLAQRQTEYNEIIAEYFESGAAHDRHAA